MDRKAHPLLRFEKHECQGHGINDCLLLINGCKHSKCFIEIKNNLVFYVHTFKNRFYTYFLKNKQIYLPFTKIN